MSVCTGRSTAGWASCQTLQDGIDYVAGESAFQGMSEQDILKQLEDWGLYGILLFCCDKSQPKKYNHMPICQEVDAEMADLDINSAAATPKVSSEAGSSIEIQSSIPLTT